MGSDNEFVQAHHSLIDPLIEPDPSDETGLNSHFASTFAPRKQPPTPPDSAGSTTFPSVNIHQHNTGSSHETNPFLHSQNTGTSVETNPYRRDRASSDSKTPAVHHGETTPRRRHDYPSPPNSASPRREHFGDHRKEAFGTFNQGRPRRSSQPSGSNPLQSGGLTRGGSLRERYPGDPSTRPLDIIRRDTKTAHRAHHLRKRNFTGADIIDRLDRTNLGGLSFSYHHEGPYDAANMARNLSYKHSPVAAVADSNEEALRATPRENIIDAVQKHRPLEGVAVVPPGMPDRLGRTYNYKEGADLMREPGADYKRWPGVPYHPDDLKGKGEPSYTIEKALKDHKLRGDSGIEMELQSRRRRNKSMGANDAPNSLPLPAESLDATASSSGIGRSNTTGKGMGSALKKRFGSITRKKVDA